MAGRGCRRWSGSGVAHDARERENTRLTTNNGKAEAELGLGALGGKKSYSKITLLSFFSIIQKLRRSYSKYIFFKKKEKQNTNYTFFPPEVKRVEYMAKKSFALTWNDLSPEA